MKQDFIRLTVNDCQWDWLSDWRWSWNMSDLRPSWVEDHLFWPVWPRAAALIKQPNKRGVIVELKAFREQPLPPPSAPNNKLLHQGCSAAASASRPHTAHIVLSPASFEWREWKAAPQFPWSGYTQEVSGVTEESCPLTKTHLLAIKLQTSNNTNKQGESEDTDPLMRVTSNKLRAQCGSAAPAEPAEPEHTDTLQKCFPNELLSSHHLISLSDF